MKKRILVFGVFCLLFGKLASAAIPGQGYKVPSLSDDFEDTSWSFNYTNNISSNGMWYGEFRGVPEVLQRITPPAGGISGQTGALQIRTYDNDGDGYPNQEDFVTKHHSQLYGRYLQRADQPSIMAHIYMPAYSSIFKTYTQPNGTDEYSTLGFRIEARSSQLSSGYYYPSIWLQYFDYETYYNKPNDPNYPPNNFGVVVRMGDGQASDVYVKNMRANYAGGWVTVGISFDAVGVGHYYFKEGVSAFTESDKIYDTTQFPGGSNAKMDWIAYNFISIGYAPNDPNLSPDYRIEDITVYKILPSTCQQVKDLGYGLKSDFNGNCRVDIEDLAVFASQWLDCVDPKNLNCHK